MKTKLLVIAALVASTIGCSSLPSSGAGCNLYAKTGAGYNFKDSGYRDGGKNVTDQFDYRFTARFELGNKCGNVNYGISHSSQWLVGYPFDNRKEPARNELFVDYIWELN